MRPEVEQAIATLQRGEPGAAEKALGLLQDTVFSFSMKVCGQREDAEDTMQETLLQTVRKLPSFTSPKALAVWLYKVAKSRCLMSRRKSKFAPKEQLSIEVLMPDRKELERLAAQQATPERAAMGRQSAERLQEVILKLPPDFRLALVLHDMEELSTEEIAKVLGISEGNVRVRLHRARLFVRNELANTGSRKRARPHTAPPRPLRCKKLFAELSNYLDQQLDDSLCDEIEQHIDGCSPCQVFLASLERTVAQCRQHRPAPLSAKRAAEIRAALTAEHQRAAAALRSRKA